MSHATNFAEMNKADLRAACKANSIKGYGNMTNDGMRAALVAAVKVEEVEEVEAVEAVVDAAPNVMTSMFGQLGVAPVAKIATPAVVTRVVEGKKIVTTPATRAAAKAAAPVRDTSVRNTYTIQKVREERNGVKHPSEGTICAAIWGYFTATPSKSAQLDSIADTNGWDRTTVHVQFYVWRKFNGIKGRQSN